jgi:predicted MFS family arabinose efflux permease
MGTVAVAGLLSTMAIPKTDLPSKLGHSRFDLSGAMQFTLVLILALIGIVRQSIFLLLCSGIFALLWVLLARGKAAAFVSPALFTNRRFISASIAANLRMLVAIAALISLPIFFEDVQGLLPVAIGGLLITYSLFLFRASWPGGRWADHAGAHIPGAVGFMLMIAGVLLLLGLDTSVNILLVVVALAVRGIGAGLTQAPYGKAAVDAAAPDQRQSAAAIYGTIRYSGLALGTALVGIFLDARLNHYGAQSGGAAALPAYHELWLLLAVLASAGLLFTWIMAKSSDVQPLAAES